MGEEELSDAELAMRIAGQSVPADPYAQLRAGIEAVFASWNSPRALAYRAHRGLNQNRGEQRGKCTDQTHPGEHDTP